MTIAALDPHDDRSVSMLVAGPAAFLVAKTHKIAERAADTSRIRDKDALDVLRILQATSTSDLAGRLRNLRDASVSADVTDEAMAQLGPLFGGRDAIGVEMAVRAAGPDADPDTIAASLTQLVVELIGSDQ